LSEAFSGATPDTMTYAKFLEWVDEDTLAEWVNGKVVWLEPASYQHQDILAFLGSIVMMFAEERGLGQTLFGLFQMKLENGRLPDLIFVAHNHLNRLTTYYLDGPADLVVEIVSPESAGRDRGEKFIEYEAGGVPEYWLLDPQRRWVEFYQLQGERYHLAYAGETGEYHARVLPGFWLRVEWLWQQPLPKVLDVLRIIGLI
jgi:Uma2 family endonuclease